MTIISHRPKSGANTSDVSLSGRNITAELWVESNDPEDTGVAVIAYLIAQGFVYGAAYNVGNDDLSSRTPLNTALYQIEPPQLAPGSATTWSVTLRYRQVTRQMQTASGTLSTSPLTRRGVITTSTVARSVIATKGIYRAGFDLLPVPNGLDWTVDEERDITNSAGVAYNPPVVIDEYNRIVRIQRNFAAVNMLASGSNWPTKWINKDPITLSDGLTTISVMSRGMKCLGWTTQPMFENDVEFVQVVFEGEIKDGGWRLELLDQGMMERTTGYYPEVEKKVAIRDDEGNAVSEPVLLDGSGHELPEGGTPRYGTWGVLPELDPRVMGFFAGIAT